MATRLCISESYMPVVYRHRQRSPRSHKGWSILCEWHRKMEMSHISKPICDMEPYLREKKLRRRWWMQLYQLSTQVEQMRLYLQVGDKKSSRKFNQAKKSQRELRSRIRNQCLFLKKWKNSSVWASRQPPQSTEVSKRRSQTQIWHLISISKALRRNKSSELQVQRWPPTTRE